MTDMAGYMTELTDPQTLSAGSQAHIGWLLLNGQPCLIQRFNKASESQLPGSPSRNGDVWVMLFSTAKELLVREDDLLTLEQGVAKKYHERSNTFKARIAIQRMCDLVTMHRARKIPAPVWWTQDLSKACNLAAIAGAATPAPRDNQAIATAPRTRSKTASEPAPAVAPAVLKPPPVSTRLGTRRGVKPDAILPIPPKARQVSAGPGTAVSGSVKRAREAPGQQQALPILKSASSSQAVSATVVKKKAPTAGPASSVVRAIPVGVGKPPKSTQHAKSSIQDSSAAAAPGQQDRPDGMLDTFPDAFKNGVTGKKRATLARQVQPATNKLFSAALEGDGGREGKRLRTIPSRYRNSPPPDPKPKTPRAGRPVPPPTDVVSGAVVPVASPTTVKGASKKAGIALKQSAGNLVSARPVDVPLLPLPASAGLPNTIPSINSPHKKDLLLAAAAGSRAAPSNALTNAIAAEGMAVTKSTSSQEKMLRAAAASAAAAVSTTTAERVPTEAAPAVTAVLSNTKHAVADKPDVAKADSLQNICSPMTGQTSVADSRSGVAADKPDVSAQQQDAPDAADMVVQQKEVPESAAITVNNTASASGSNSSSRAPQSDHTDPLQAPPLKLADACTDADHPAGTGDNDSTAVTQLEAAGSAASCDTHSKLSAGSVLGSGSGSRSNTTSVLGAHLDLLSGQLLLGAAAVPVEVQVASPSDVSMRGAADVLVEPEAMLSACETHAGVATTTSPADRPATATSPAGAFGGFKPSYRVQEKSGPHGITDIVRHAAATAEPEQPSAENDSFTTPPVFGLPARQTDPPQLTTAHIKTPTPFTALLGSIGKGRSGSFSGAATASPNATANDRQGSSDNQDQSTSRLTPSHLAVSTYTDRAEVESVPTVSGNGLTFLAAGQSSIAPVPSGAVALLTASVAPVVTGGAPVKPRALSDTCAAGVLALNQIQALLTKSAAEPSPSQSTNHGRFPTIPTLVPRPSPSALHNKSSRTVPAPARVVGSVELAGELGEPQLAFSVIQAAHRGIVSTLANVSTAVPLGINPGAAAFDGLRVNPVMYPSTIGASPTHCSPAGGQFSTPHPHQQSGSDRNGGGGSSGTIHGLDLQLLPSLPGIPCPIITTLLMDSWIPFLQSPASTTSVRLHRLLPSLGGLVLIITPLHFALASHLAARVVGMLSSPDIPHAQAMTAETSSPYQLGPVLSGLLSSGATPPAGSNLCSYPSAPIGTSSARSVATPAAHGLCPLQLSATLAHLFASPPNPAAMPFLAARLPAAQLQNVHGALMHLFCNFLPLPAAATPAVPAAAVRGNTATPAPRRDNSSDNTSVQQGSYYPSYEFPTPEYQAAFTSPQTGGRPVARPPLSGPLFPKSAALAGNAKGRDAAVVAARRPPQPTPHKPGHPPNTGRPQAALGGRFNETLQPAVISAKAVQVDRAQTLRPGRAADGRKGGDRADLDRFQRAAGLDQIHGSGSRGLLSADRAAAQSSRPGGCTSQTQNWNSLSNFTATNPTGGAGAVPPLLIYNRARDSERISKLAALCAFMSPPDFLGGNSKTHYTSKQSFPSDDEMMDDGAEAKGRGRTSTKADKSSRGLHSSSSSRRLRLQRSCDSTYADWTPPSVRPKSGGTNKTRGSCAAGGESRCCEDADMGDAEGEDEELEIAAALMDLCSAMHQEGEAGLLAGGEGQAGNNQGGAPDDEDDRDAANGSGQTHPVPTNPPPAARNKRTHRSQPPDSARAGKKRRLSSLLDVVDKSIGTVKQRSKKRRRGTAARRKDQKQQEKTRMQQLAIQNLAPYGQLHSQQQPPPPLHQHLHLQLQPAQQHLQLQPAQPQQQPHLQQQLVQLQPVEQQQQPAGLLPLFQMAPASALLAPLPQQPAQQPMPQVPPPDNGFPGPQSSMDEGDDDDDDEMTEDEGSESEGDESMDED